MPTINLSLSLSCSDAQAERWRENSHSIFSNIVHTCNWCLGPPITQTMQWNLLLDCRESAGNKTIISLNISVCVCVCVCVCVGGMGVVHWKRKEEQKACWYIIDLAVGAVRLLLNNLYFYGNWDADVLETVAVENAQTRPKLICHLPSVFQSGFSILYCFTIYNIIIFYIILHFL